ncbi:MAG: aldehyde dehydrogenase family protein [Crocinitomicaceae bacterium]|nr:aldehyde dehydrogenase family protein [Crocinitomicaceae bacterium]
MNKEILLHIFQQKKDFFNCGTTRPYEFRIRCLQRLETAVRKNEKAICNAASMDFGKPAFEMYGTEIAIVISEIRYAIHHLKEWMKPQKVNLPIVIQPSSAKIYPEPRGVVLIISPWNYPFQLSLVPLVGAIAAGNCAIIKPSENVPTVNAVIEKIFAESLPAELISLITGDYLVGAALTENFSFDHIFFTGSIPVGKKILEAAAKNLTPVSLELGGKSPAIVDNNCNLEVAAKRIVWGKFLNAGQTCVAPDYLLVRDGVKEKLIERIKKTIVEFYGELPSSSDSYARIINSHRFDVLASYLTQGSLLHGGRSDREALYIEPTLIEGVDETNSVMQEEIFGPVLPVISWSVEEDILRWVKKNNNPLALYLFTRSPKLKKFVIENIRFGGGVINSTLIQFGSPEIPVGGIGSSGVGRYHGRYTFEMMSHYKPVVDAATWFDPSLRYPPYTKRKMKWLRRIF